MNFFILAVTHSKDLKDLVDGLDNNPDIVLLQATIDTMKELGIRDDYIVLVGGAPLNEEFSKSIGADAYCRDAAVAVETASKLIKQKHNQIKSN